MIPWLGRAHDFPPLERALGQPNGLLAAGGDLSAGRLLAAYSRGIFPWFSDGEPILWWSPDPRMVLYPAEVRVSRSLRKALRRDEHEVRVDTAFTAVMRACAEPRPHQAGTWIVPAMIGAYAELHARGYAHSVETWRAGELVGGLYGVRIRRFFAGESMFSSARDASKVALVALVDMLTADGVTLLDVQWSTPHLESLGAIDIPRDEYLRRLDKAVGSP